MNWFTSFWARITLMFYIGMITATKPVVVVSGIPVVITTHLQKLGLEIHPSLPAMGVLSYRGKLYILSNPAMDICDVDIVQACIAHELGHITHGHLYNNSTILVNDVDKEIVADAFAVEHGHRDALLRYLTVINRELKNEDIQRRIAAIAAA